VELKRPGEAILRKKFLYGFCIGWGSASKRRDEVVIRPSHFASVAPSGEVFSIEVLPGAEVVPTPQLMPKHSPIYIKIGVRIRIGFKVCKMVHPRSQHIPMREGIFSNFVDKVNRIEGPAACLNKVVVVPSLELFGGDTR
jgi:hypothetical protein